MDASSIISKIKKPDDLAEKRGNFYQTSDVNFFLFKVFEHNPTRWIDSTAFLRRPQKKRLIRNSEDAMKFSRNNQIEMYIY